MLLDSLCLLGAAAVVGIGLAVWYLQSEGRHVPNWTFGVLHAGLAIAGFVMLLLALNGPALNGPARGVAVGAAGFGKVAAAFLVFALLTGLVPASARLRRRRLPLPSLVIGMHATLAISGLVILAAYYALIR